jgi:3-dehydroquinate synthase
MKTLEVDLGSRSYPIHIGPGLLSQGALIATHLGQKRVAIVTNDRVGPMYMRALSGALSELGIEVVPVVLPDGEEHKDWQTLNRIFDTLLENGCERKTTVIALGGGVVGDMAGCAAALYQRGVPFIQIPTTLLAQVDSAVGGKTAINHPLGKNMIGAFHQPRVVIADTDTLKTLPGRELRAGLAEVIKYGLIRDPAFFAWLEEHMTALLSRDDEALVYAIEQSCRNKAEVVAKDETESDVRALLNFGHTFGHAIETGLGFGTWLHGEAVAAGMVLAIRASIAMKLIDPEVLVRTQNLLRQAELPITAPALGVDRYIELMMHDKKVDSGKVRFVLLRALGDAYVGSIPPDILHDLLSEAAHE